MIAILACKRGAPEQATPEAATQASAAASTSAAPIEAGAALAANESDVKRFADEKKLDGSAAKLEWGSSKIRKAPQGDVVTVLLKGAEAERLAEHAGFVLIRFVDPKDASRHLMGWVYADAFKADPPCHRDADCTPPFICGAPNDIDDPENTRHCYDARSPEDRTCEKDKDCRPGLECRTFPLDPDSTANPNRRCAKPCTTDAQCQTDRRCGRAIDGRSSLVCSRYGGTAAEEGACKVDADCAFPMRCFAHLRLKQCLHPCDAKKGCGAGHSCDKGMCLKGTSVVLP